MKRIVFVFLLFCGISSAQVVIPGSTSSTTPSGVSVRVRPRTCTGTEKVTGIDAAGNITCNLDLADTATHQIDGVALTSPSPVNFLDTSVFDWTNPAAGNLSLALKANSVPDSTLASDYSGIGACTNSFPRTLNANAAPTCAQVDLGNDVTGVFVDHVTLDNQRELRLREDDVNGDEYLGLRVKAAITTSRTLTINVPESGNCTGTNGGNLTILTNEIVCADDDGGVGGSGDAIEIEQADTGVFDAIDTTARFDGSGDITFVFADGGAGGPDIVTATVKANSVALTTDTTGNYVGTVAAGTGLAVTGADAENATKTVALDYTDQGASPALNADECRFTSNATVSGFIVCEGDTPDAFEARIHVVDPTADRAFTIPNADSVAVQPDAGASNNFLTAISTLGVVSKAQPSFTNISGTADEAQLDANVVLDNAANTYTAGAKQTFQNSATTAGVNLASSADPSGLAQGDLWLNADDLKFRGSAATQTAERQANKNAASGYAGLTGSTKLNLAHGQEVWGLADLSDVSGTSGSGSTAVLSTMTTLAADQLLKRNGANANWVNATIQGVANETDVIFTDTTITIGIVNPLSFALGGTGLAAAADDTVIVSNGSLWQAKGIPDCDVGGTDKLLYDTSTNSFSCGADQGGSSADAITINTVAVADADFDDSTPAAPANGFNVKWQKDAASPANVSAHLLTTDVTTTTWGGGSGWTWTFNAGATDPTLAFASASVTLGSADLLFGTNNANDLAASGTRVRTGYFGTSVISPLWASSTGDVADAGVGRFLNADSLCWEASPAGTDICITVNSSEELQLGSTAAKVDPSGNATFNTVTITASGNIDLSDGNALTVSCTNEGTTGTTANLLAKFTGAPTTCRNAEITDTGGVVGITVAGAGTAGSARVTVAGEANCTFPGATVAGNYVGISDSAAGNCKDVGASYPSSGQVIGRVLTTNGAGGTFTVQLFGPEIKGGGGGGGDSITVATVAATDPDIIDSGRIDFTLDTGASPDTITADIVANSVNATHIDETAAYAFSSTSNTFMAAAGSATTPSLALVDTNDGFYHSAGDAVSLTLAGTLRYTFASPAMTLASTNASIEWLDSNTAVIRQASGHLRFGSTASTVPKRFDIYGGDGATNAEPAILRLVASPVSGDTTDVWLSPCSTDGRLALTAADPSTDDCAAGEMVMTASSTDTKTGLTLDVEGTGNVFTDVQEIVIDFASCVAAAAFLEWDDDAEGVTEPVAACNDTGIRTVGSADFSGSAQNAIQRTFRSPTGWTGVIDAVLRYATTAASPTGNVEWEISTHCIAVAESWDGDGSWNAPQTITDAVGSQNNLNDATQTSLTNTGCAAGEDLAIKIARDGVNDTNNDLAKALSLTLTIRRQK